VNRFDRRRFLKGAFGVTVALPFLETLAPRVARAAAAPPKRLVVFFTCNGVNMDTWFPKTAPGPLTATSWTGQATEPLNKYYNKILIPTGVNMSPGGLWYGDAQTNVQGGDHGCGMISKLTCAQAIVGPGGGSEKNRASGASLDQVAAASINPAGRTALTLGVCVTGNDSVSYSTYSASGVPAPPITNPWNAYRDMVAATPAAAAGVDRTALRRKSVLDLVSAEKDALKQKGLSTADQQKLDQHYTAIRDFEVATQQAGLVACRLPDNGAAMQALTNPTDYANFPTVGKLQMDLMAIALACDYTRVTSIQWGEGSRGPVFKWDGINHTYAHHPLSHHATNDADSNTLDAASAAAMVTQIDNWYAKQYVALLDRMAAYTEPGGTMLDNSVVVWANELSDGLGHSGINLPFAIAGSGSGYLKNGVQVHLTEKQTNIPADRWDQGAPHNKLFTTLLNAVGVRDAGGNPLTMFGLDGNTGEYTELKV
jgi:hypothetical protein